MGNGPIDMRIEEASTVENGDGLFPFAHFQSTGHLDENQCHFDDRWRSRFQPLKGSSELTILKMSAAELPFLHMFLNGS